MLEKQNVRFVRLKGWSLYNFQVIVSIHPFSITVYPALGVVVVVVGGAGPDPSYLGVKVGFILEQNSLI